VLAGVALSFGLGAVFRTWRARSERTSARRQLAQITQLSADALDGAVARVTGVVEATGDVLRAPASGRDCVAYRTRVEGRHVTDSNALEQVQICRFRVGDVVIESEHARFDLQPCKLVPSVEQTARYDAFLRPYGRTRHYFGGGAVFREVVVCPGARVTVVGLVMHEARAIAPGEELGFRDRPPSIVRLVGDKDHPIIIGDAID